jgi:hypothetical protein
MAEHSKFWKKVLKCEHEHLSEDYCEIFRCGTPYCSGDEVHCLDCGVYISECGCGFENGMSGWSRNRHRTEERKRSERRRIKSVV